jgi:GAF domain-containing protein
MSDVQQLLARFAGEHIGDQGRGLILSLLQITQGLSPHMGEDYFRALTRELATVLESSIVYVGEFNRTARTVRSIACWENGRFREELEYHVDAAPCADVVAGRRTVHLEGAARRFPGHGLLQQYEIEAYVGVPIRDGGGGVQGLIVLLWPEPVEKIDDLLSTVELCTPRAGAELERHREEQARHKAQELIRQSQRAAEQARDAAEQTSRAKDQFLAALSHELRTPLTPVLLAATHLQSLQTLPTQVRESVEVIYHGVALEARLIDDLLDIARISNGKLDLQPAPVNIHDVIGTARQI